jgi:hypothetical protein
VLLALLLISVDSSLKECGVSTSIRDTIRKQNYLARFCDFPMFLLPFPG